MLAGHFLHRQYRGRYYAKAQNQSRRLRAAYDEQLTRYDLLLMPTVPRKAIPMPAADASRKEIVQHALAFDANCDSTNLTGHPALSIPCGLADGLPVGVMLVGRHYEEATLYRAAHAFERANDWKTL
jgi:amidase